LFRAQWLALLLALRRLDESARALWQGPFWHWIKLSPELTEHE
jgi:hypothetical protein